MSILCRLIGHDFREIRQKERTLEPPGGVRGVRYLFCKRCRKLFKEYEYGSDLFRYRWEVQTGDLLHAMVIQNDLELLEELKQREMEAALDYLRG